MTNVIRHATDVIMAGLDHHNGLYHWNILMACMPTPPLPPAPLPPGLLPIPPVSFHLVGCPITWPSNGHFVPSVLVEGDPIVQRNHKTEYVPHIPPGCNYFVPVTIYFSGSTWKLGVATVMAGDKAVASTILGPLFATYNCNDPVSFPSGRGYASASVIVSPTQSDLWDAFVEMAVQAVVELFCSAILSVFGGMLKNWISKRFGMYFAKRSAYRATYAAAKEVIELSANRRQRDLARLAMLRNLRNEALDDIRDVWRKKKGLGPGELSDEIRKGAAKEARDEAGKIAAKKFTEAEAEKEAAEKAAKQALKDAKSGEERKAAQRAYYEALTRDPGAEGAQQGAAQATEGALKPANIGHRGGPGTPSSPKKTADPQAVGQRAGRDAARDHGTTNAAKDYGLDGGGEWGKGALTDAAEAERQSSMSKPEPEPK